MTTNDKYLTKIIHLDNLVFHKKAGLVYQFIGSRQYAKSSI